MVKHPTNAQLQLGLVDSNHQLPQSTTPPAEGVAHEDNELADGRSADTERKTSKTDAETVTQPSRASAPSEDL